MRKLRNEKRIVFSLLCLALFLSFPVCVLSAEEIIDPEEYVLTVGRIESLEGTAVIVRESGKEQFLNTGDLIISENVVEYIENIDDRDTLNDGFKKLKEKLILKTDPDSEVKIVLDDFHKNDDIITVGAETEVELIISGGCVYASDGDCEGFDYDTLRWRHRDKYLELKVNSGIVKVSYNPDENYFLKVKSDNFDNYTCRRKGNTPAEFEVEVSLEKRTQNLSLTPTPDIELKLMEDAINNTIKMMLMVHNVEKFEDLDQDIKADIEELLAELESLKKEKAEEMEDTDSSINERVVETNLTTFVRVYKNQLEIENKLVKAGEMAIIKSSQFFDTFEVEEF